MMMMLLLIMMVITALCTLKAILKGDEEVKAWLDYESVPLDEVQFSNCSELC